MQFSTTPTLEGQPITEYCGVVTGEAILGANIFRDFFAGIRDIVGGRSGAYEKELRKGDNLILSAFGGGYTWGAIYVKWAYDGSKACQIDSSEK